MNAKEVAHKICQEFFDTYDSKEHGDMTAIIQSAIDADREEQASTLEYAQEIQSTHEYIRSAIEHLSKTMESPQSQLTALRDENAKLRERVNAAEDIMGRVRQVHNGMGQALTAYEWPLTPNTEKGE